MPGSARIHKSTLLSDVSNQKKVKHFSQEQQSRAANCSVRSRSTLSIVREPVNSIEHAMDVAIGAEGEPWDEKKEAA